MTWLKRAPLYVSGACHVTMRTPGSISCYWRCDKPASHEGLHVWGGLHDEMTIEFTTEQAERSLNGKSGAVLPERYEHHRVV